MIEKYEMIESLSLEECCMGRLQVVDWFLVNRLSQNRMVLGTECLSVAKASGRVSGGSILASEVGKWFTSGGSAKSLTDTVGSRSLM